MLRWARDDWIIYAFRGVFAPFAGGGRVGAAGAGRHRAGARGRGWRAAASARLGCRVGASARTGPALQAERACVEGSVELGRGVCCHHDVVVGQVGLVGAAGQDEYRLEALTEEGKESRQGS